MYISKRKENGEIRGATIALFVVLSAFFTSSLFAQVPVQINVSDYALQSSDLSLSSDLTALSDDHDYEATDFTFELADLETMVWNNNHNTSHTIKCQKATDLDFGRAFSGITAGTVVMSPNTSVSRVKTGGVILDNRNMGHPAHIQLTIYNSDHCDKHDHQSNDDDQCGRSEDDDSRHDDTRHGFTRHGVWNTIALPSSSTLSLTLGGHTYTMTADTYTFIRNNGDFYIGATLHVAANQVAGVYHGTFTVTQTCD